MPTGGEPPQAHASGYKSGSLSRVQAKVAVPQNRFGGSKGYRDRAAAPRGQQPDSFFAPARSGKSSVPAAPFKFIIVAVPRKTRGLNLSARDRFDKALDSPGTKA